MNTVSCFAHCAMIVDLLVDDETGEISNIEINSAYEIGRALNPKLMEQQLVGGAWMGMSHAAYETTEPFYPDRKHLPYDFSSYVMPGPGDLAKHSISILERPAPDGPFGGKGIGEMCANPVLPAIANAVFDAVGVEIDSLPISPESIFARFKGKRCCMITRFKGLDSPQDVKEALSQALYISSDELATTIYLAMVLGKPILLEGAPGVGKTEAAKALASTLSCALIRLQCYEGIDSSAALYEWNFPKQMLAMRQTQDTKLDIYNEDFLIERPLLQALNLQSEGFLLIDEIDRADHEFEAFLLEFLSDFQITIPERGSIRAARRPFVVLTSNRTRDLHEALRRRCVYHWIDYPSPSLEVDIVMVELPMSLKPRLKLSWQQWGD